MYDAVFSALMTLMGLSFAAIGLLLQAKEKHWVRHAHIWRRIRPHIFLSGAIIFVSTLGILMIMEAESNTTYSLTLWGLPESESSVTSPLSSWTWWLVLLLFGVSLASLWLLIRIAIKNLQEENILKRMREKHFSDQLGDISDAKVKEFFAKISQLLTATLDVGDLATYEQILEIAIVDVAGPRERNGKSNQEPIRINNQGKIACDGLSALRAQIDFSMDNPVAARATSSACLVAIKKIVDSWIPTDHGHQEDASAATAQKVVIEHAVEDFGFVAEFLLSAPRPSLSLVTVAADIGKSISSEKSEVVAHDSAVAQKSAERILNGAQRALSAGYSKEALVLLDAIRPWLHRSWKFIPTLVRLSVVGPKESNDIENFLSELFKELQVDAKSLSAEDIDLLAPVLVEALSGLSEQTQLKLRNALFRLVSLVVSALDDLERIEFFLDSVVGADDKIVQQFLQRYVLGNDVAPNHPEPLQKFFRNHIEFYGLEPMETVEKLCQLVYSVGRAIAKDKPKRINFFQKTLVKAYLDVNESADVNPIVSALNAACAVEERDRLKRDTEIGNTKILYHVRATGIIRRTPRLTPRRPPRSEWNYWVAHCFGTMKTLTFARRNENLSPGFSSELGRRFLVSIAHLVIDLELEDPHNQRAVLLDEKIIAACELALSWESWDQYFSDVTASLSWMRDSAALVFADVWPAGNNQENLRKRWYQIFLLCTVALANLDKDLPALNLSVDHQNWLEQPNILDDLRENAEQLISERLTNPRAGAAKTMSTSYENFVKKLELVTGALVEFRSENPEEEIYEDCSKVEFQTPEMKDEFCARLLTAAAKMRIPDWAKATNELSKSYAEVGGVGGAYYLLRIVRACLKKNGMVFHPEGLLYVVRVEGLPSEETPAWFDEVVETLAQDWLAYKFNQVNSEESRKERRRIYGIKRAARGDLVENVKEWSRSRN